MKHEKEVSRVLNVLAIVSLTLFLLTFVFDLPNVFTALVACLSTIVAVGIAYLRRPWVYILCWIVMSCTNVLIGMELTFPDILGKLF